MDLANIALDRQTLSKEAKICANKKSELALEYLHAKMVSAQAKKDADAAHKAQANEKKRDDCENRNHCSTHFGSNMASFTFCWKNIDKKSLIVIFYVLG